MKLLAGYRSKAGTRVVGSLSICRFSPRKQDPLCSPHIDAARAAAGAAFERILADHLGAARVPFQSEERLRALQFAKTPVSPSSSQLISSFSRPPAKQSATMLSSATVIAPLRRCALPDFEGDARARTPPFSHSALFPSFDGTNRTPIWRFPSSSTAAPSTGSTRRPRSATRKCTGSKACGSSSRT